jgi:acyl carrier protein
VREVRDGSRSCFDSRYGVLWQSSTSPIVSDRVIPTFLQRHESQILSLGFANSGVTKLTTLQPKKYGGQTRCGFQPSSKDLEHMSSDSTEFSSETEHELASLWQQVLNTDSLPRPSDDFFSLGGDSVAMIMAELRIKEEFSVDLPEGAMLGISSLRELSQLIEKSR